MYGMKAVLSGIISHLWFYINKEISEEELDPWEWSIEEPADLEAKKYQVESSGEGDSQLLQHFSRSISWKV